MRTLIRNLHYGLRGLRKSPGLTAAVIATLMLGIGATTAIYTVVYAVLLAPLPYPQPDQLVMVWSKVNGGNNGMSAGDFLDWKEQSKSFQQLCAFPGGSFNLATQDQPEQLDGMRATPGWFSMQGIPFLMGRDFLPEEGIPGKDHAVILTYRLWNRLGANRGILGQPIRVNGEPYTVVGVLSPGVGDRFTFELSAPLAFRPEQINHDYHWLLTMGRLKNGVTLQQAQADMDAVTSHIAAAYPVSNKGWGASVEPLKNDFLPRERIQNLWLLLGAVGFVLLITCLNIANLLLAKGSARQREIAIRSSVGANRGQIFGQFLTESLVLAVLGGGLGVGLGVVLLRAILAIVPDGILPSEANFQLDGHVLFVALAATTLAGLLFGCAPAWYASRVDPAESLKDGGRSGTGNASHKLRRVLIMGEFALALSLLAGAGLAIHSFWNLTRVDLGLRTDHVFTFSLPVPDSRSKDPVQIAAYYRNILAHIDAVPGVSHAAVFTGYPLHGMGFGMPFTLAGGPAYSDPSQRPGSGFGMVTPDYVSTFGLHLVKGRSFSEQDTANGVKVAMVNQSFAKKYLQGKDPLRQRVVVEQLIPGVQKLGPGVEWQIVGVYQDVHAADWHEHLEEMLVPFWQIPWPQATVGVRTAENPASMQASIAAAVHAVDPQIALAEPKTLDQIREESLADERFTLILFGCFAVVALFLATLGIYGVVAFSVAQRSHEIAIRMALGATRNRVLTLVVREGTMLAAIGLGLGLIGAYFVGRAMQSMLFDVRALDLSAFSVVALILLASALLACYLPARRAASVEPMRVLRTE